MRTDKKHAISQHTSILCTFWGKKKTPRGHPTDHTLRIVILNISFHILQNKKVSSREKYTTIGSKWVAVSCAIRRLVYKLKMISDSNMAVVDTYLRLKTIMKSIT